VGELQPLCYPEDVEPFIRRWFDHQPERGEDLAAQVARRPGLQQAATAPLVLAFYCIVGGREPRPDFPAVRGMYVEDVDLRPHDEHARVHGKGGTVRTCCSTTAATSPCSGSTSPGPGTPGARCSAPASTAGAVRCPTTRRTTGGRSTAPPPALGSASTSSATAGLKGRRATGGRAYGTAGMKVTVWDVSPSPEGAIKEATETVRALRKLGYRASLRLLPPSTYFAVTSDSRNHAQVIDGGWSADYASADDFIGKLTCAYFVPGDSVATDDAGGFCDPGLDRQIARAAAQQTSNPAAAAAQWARLDRQLTDLAIWIPTITPNEIDFLSSRVRNYQYNPVWGALIDQFWIR
jgi:hypothetical protein